MREAAVANGGVAHTLLQALFWLWAGSEVLIRVTRPRHTGVRQDRETRLVIMLGLLGGLGGGSVVAGARRGPWIANHSWVLFGAGLVLGLAGIALRLWAVHTLGRYFQLHLVVQEGHRVVREGPYRIIRHPSYAGPILTCIGIGLALDNWVSLVLCAVLPTAAMVRRIVVEERMLLTGLGDDYARYSRDTSRLLPGVW